MLTRWLAHPAVHRGWGGRPLGLAEVRAKYTGCRAPAVLSWIIVRDGAPCGYVQAWRGPDRHGLDLFVSAGAQGRGTGRRAAALLARHLDGHGWRPLTVDPAADDPAAVAMWTAAGFVRPRDCDVGPPDDAPARLLLAWQDCSAELP